MILCSNRLHKMNNHVFNKLQLLYERVDVRPKGGVIYVVGFFFQIQN